jgi:gliding motility-associated protein GldE
MLDLLVIYSNPLTPGLALILLICLLLLLVSALVSASEVAFFSLSPQHLLDLKNTASEKDKRILNLLKDSKRLLATILIANNFVNILLVVLSAYFISAWFDFSEAPLWKFFVETVVITFLLLFFGEILPKVYASQNSLKFSRFIVDFIFFLRKVLSPFSKILVVSTKVLNKRMKRHSQENLSMDEISEALELTTNVEEEEKDMLQGIVHFGNTLVEGAMTSRIDMEVLNIKTPFNKVLEKIVECGYSRIPVYSGSYDDIKGVLYIKDLIPYIGYASNFKWQSLIRPAYFVPETKKIDDLLSDFQKNKTHMAIVVDEFGGTSGLITMEDILEEIMGEIEDEYDEDESLYTKVDDATYIFEAKILLNDFYRVTDISDAEFEDVAVDVDSLAGLILELKGEIPNKNEKITYKNYTFEILSSDNRRIKKVKFYIEK